MIHGLRVFGGNGDLSAVCSQHEVDEVVISSVKMTEERIRGSVADLLGKADHGEANADHDGRFDVRGLR